MGGSYIDYITNLITITEQKVTMGSTRAFKRAIGLNLYGDGDEQQTNGENRTVEWWSVTEQIAGIF